MIVKPNNKKEVILDDVKLKEEIIKNDSIAIMLEQSDGTYKESNESMFPSNMIFNSEKSGCIDKEGKSIDNSLTYSNGLITIETNKTTYCYVYFDRKADGSLTLSETNGTVNKGKTSTFTVTNNASGGSLSVASGDNNIATASVSGNTITITGVNEGSTTITVTSAETSNYLASSVTYIVTVNAVATVIINNVGLADHCYVSIDGVQYISPTEITVPVGTTIYSHVKTGTGSNGEYSYIYVNGNQVAASSTSTYGEYNYTVTGDVIINMSNGASGWYGSEIWIEEVPEDYAFVRITGSGYYNGCYVTINESKYSSAKTIAVPIGTPIYCYAISNDGYDSGYYGLIWLNGSRVATATNSTTQNKYYAEYNYIINGNLTISLNGGGTSGGGGEININEN